jgi:glycosyltransferase involved in cell wall biosynthesis
VILEREQFAPILFEREATADLVSIIVPTYRKERFIAETLASVGRQTYANWELIVVEDGSRGHTEQIVREFASRHHARRVEYHRNDHNYGAARTRNVAFAKAYGEFIALLDSDDRWLPDYLRVSLEALRSSGKDIAYSTVLMIEDQTEFVLGIWGPSAHELESFPRSLLQRNFITPSATVLRRDVLARVGEWDNQFRYCEDADFWLRCVAAGLQFQHVGGCHCLYRKNHDGATTQRLCGAVEEFAEIVDHYARKSDLPDRARRKAACRAFLHAAQLHATADPARDPSADRSRVGPLLLRAWRLRPTHLEYLWQGAKLSVLDWLRPPRSTAPSPSRRAEPPRRAAA